MKKHALAALAWFLVIASIVLFGGSDDAIGTEIANDYSSSFSPPPQATQYRRTLMREVRQYHGLKPTYALHAAIIHQESTWRKDAKSPVGAQGLAQFMPSTAEWMPEIDSNIGSVDPFNPKWSIRAMASYTSWLLKRVDADDFCNQNAKMLSAYNGGIGWISRDEDLADKKGYNSGIWFDGVENYSKRADWAFKENRHYVRRIALELQMDYKNTQFNAPGGVITCQQEL